MTYWFDPIIGGANGPGGAGLERLRLAGASQQLQRQQAAKIAAIGALRIRGPILRAVSGG